ncbi:DMT family transporter [Ferruginibacter albus]|uniref:DMT family transporter n=1 Tax=Ferruginibacter albus TaxID=2875540 RepID=UPI001CC79568|nr:SMR family transporter [Ferruginibacter albus]UAY51519.1 hypothetical protein K9M53_13095 [Ferruginibacter albus]
MAWIYLFIASIFEIGWTYSLKYLDLRKFKQVDWHHLFSQKQNLFIVLPLLGYIVFGLSNIYFFSIAMKQMPASVALAVWMGVVIIGIKIIDITLFKEPYQFSQFIYMAFILIGIIGLKKSIG